MRIQVLAPPNTPPTNPVSIQQFFDFPVINSIVVKIPFGHSFLTGLKILDNNGFPLLPDHNSNVPWLVDDSREIISRRRIEFNGPKWWVVCQAYNTDDTWPHTFYIDIE